MNSEKYNYTQELNDYLDKAFEPSTVYKDLKRRNQEMKQNFVLLKDKMVKKAKSLNIFKRVKNKISNKVAQVKKAFKAPADEGEKSIAKDKNISDQLTQKPNSQGLVLMPARDKDGNINSNTFYYQATKDCPECNLAEGERSGTMYINDPEQLDFLQQKDSNLAFNLNRNSHLSLSNSNVDVKTLFTDNNLDLTNSKLYVVDNSDVDKIKMNNSVAYFSDGANAHNVSLDDCDVSQNGSFGLRDSELISSNINDSEIDQSTIKRSHVDESTVKQSGVERSRLKDATLGKSYATKTQLYSSELENESTLNGGFLQNTAVNNSDLNLHVRGSLHDSAVDRSVIDSYTLQSDYADIQNSSIIGNQRNRQMLTRTSLHHGIASKNFKAINSDLSVPGSLIVDTDFNNQSLPQYSRNVAVVKGYKIDHSIPGVQESISRLAGNDKGQTLKKDGKSISLKDQIKMMVHSFEKEYDHKFNKSYSNYNIEPTHETQPVEKTHMSQPPEPQAPEDDENDFASLLSSVPPENVANNPYDNPEYHDPEPVPVTTVAPPAPTRDDSFADDAF